MGGGGREYLQVTGGLLALAHVAEPEVLLPNPSPMEAPEMQSLTKTPWTILMQAALFAALAIASLTRPIQAEESVGCRNLPSGATENAYCLEESQGVCASQNGSYCARTSSGGCLTGTCVCAWYGCW